MFIIYKLMLFLLLLEYITSIIFNLKNNNNNKMKLNKIWNLLDTSNELYENTITIENDIKSLLNKKIIIKDEYIKGCYESKTIGINNIPEWKKYSNIITKLIPNNNNNNNKNYQIFSSSSNRFINLSEYYNQNFFATAIGTYKKSENSKFIANVTEICIYFNLLKKLNKIIINVNGNGIINIIYEDNNYRIVENEFGAKALQKKVLISSFYKELLKID